MLGIDTRVIGAIFRKDMRQYLANPIGYVFLTLFMTATAAAAFLGEGFFSRNLADLTELNAWMPLILMFFVPALTMGSWAEERRGGTDELLLTMPVRDAEVVVGKYLGVLGMFTVSLAFSVTHVIVLSFLGDPDPGLMFSTYVGYWLAGAMFCGIGLFASMLTQNPAIAFVLGLLGCAMLVVAGREPWASGLVGTTLIGALAALGWFVARGEARGAGRAGVLGAVAALAVWLSNASSAEQSTTADHDWFVGTFDALSVTRHFASFGEGVVRMGDVFYFVSGAVLMLYLGTLLLGRRHW